MVNGARFTSIKDAYRFGHRFGIRLLSGLVLWMFGKQFVSAGFYLFKTDDSSDRLHERNDSKQQLICTILAAQRDRMSLCVALLSDKRA